MNKFKLFIILFISNISGIFACAEFYPENEHIRFKLFNAELFCSCSFAQFRYTAHYFYETATGIGCAAAIPPAEELNIDLWRKYLNDKFSKQEVYDALYKLPIANEGANSQNKFIRFLFLPENKAVLTYCLLMQKCATVNNLQGDPWERNEDQAIQQKVQLFEAVKEAAQNEKINWFKKRYSFLAIRLSYYLGDSESIKTLYETYFKSAKHVDLVDYWALYFYCLFESPGPLRNLHAAQVYRYAPDKRLAIYNLYSTEIDINSTLSCTTSKEDENAVYLMQLVHSVGRSIVPIQHLLENQAPDEIVDFAVNRELSKIEDWIGTVYYSNFSPIMAEWDQSKALLSAQMERDRAYANNLLQILQLKLDSKSRKRLGLQISYLEFLCKQNEKALIDIDEVLSSGNLSAAQKVQAKEIKALVVLVLNGTTVTPIPQFCYEVLQNAQKEQHNHFLFAMAKELELKGNTTQAAALLAKVNSGRSYYDLCFWRAKNSVRDYYADYFDNYFFYLNTCYSVEAMQKLMGDIEKPVANKFNDWLIKELAGNRYRLYDLTGTKYLRASNYQKAFEAFKHVPDSVWKNFNYPYRTYLNANPFYTNLYNEHGPTPADNVRLTKTEIVEKLLYLLEKANDTKNPDSDYAAFIAANCFLNMTYYGNSWLMSNYYWSTYVPDEVKRADAEFYTCERAKTYYLKAMQNSKDEAFKALCLRMAGRCEKYRLMFEYDLQNKGTFDEHLDERIFKANSYYRQLKHNFPEQYDDLISNCESFDRYFLPRKKKVVHI